MMAVLNAAVAGFANRSRDLLAGVVIIDAANPCHYDGVTSINDLRGKTSEAVAVEPSSKSSVAQGFSCYPSGHTRPVAIRFPGRPPEGRDHFARRALAS
jgi:predicted dinucleotide-binding enzyme